MIGAWLWYLLAGLIVLDALNGRKKLAAFSVADEKTEGAEAEYAIRLDRCDECGHIFQNPRLTPVGLDYYYRDIYDGLGREAARRQEGSRVSWVFPGALQPGSSRARMPTWTYLGTPVFGHTNPTLSVVAELGERGERIIYYNSERFGDAIRATGAGFRYYRGMPELPQAMSTRMVELVLLSRGKADAAHSSLAAPKNFRIESYVPRLAVLRRSAAFVTHGGIGSASEALHCGAPQVFPPQIWDGYLMSHQVSQAGAGILLPSQPTAEQLRPAVRTVLDDNAYRDKARSLGAGLTSAGGAVEAADAIQGWARSQSGAAPRSSTQQNGQQVLAQQ